MASPRETAKRLIGSVPPFSWLRKEKSALQAEIINLSQERDTLRFELKKTPPLWQPPGHFYSPIPSLRELERNADDIFRVPPAIRGVDLNVSGQLELLEEFCGLYAEQPFTAAKTPGRRYFFENENFGYTDSIVLYSMMRYLRPKRVVEVGCGYSSCAMLDVDDLFLDGSIDFTFIDPYPQLLRSMLSESDRRRTRIVARKVQDVDVEVFRALGPSDILFIDSSHVVKTGSDVNYLVFKILPLLAAGVWIHIHDIPYPFEYPTSWVMEGRAWSEAYLIRAFLQYNHAFQIRFFTSYLMHSYREVFETNMPLCVRNTGGSLWLEKVIQDPQLERFDARTERTRRPAPRRVVPEELIGEGWYEHEGDHCWMADEASIELAGPVGQESRIHIRGFNPHERAQLSVAVDGGKLGSFDMSRPGEFDVEFPLPHGFIGRPRMDVRLTMDTVYSVPGDPRTLGLSVNLIEVV